MKWFQYEGRFPSHRIEIPPVVLTYPARQLDVSADRFARYRCNTRTMERHRAQIRRHLELRAATVKDAKHLIAWLVAEVLAHTREEEALKAAPYERCRKMPL